MKAARLHNNCQRLGMTKVFCAAFVIALAFSIRASAVVYQTGFETPTFTVGNLAECQSTQSRQTPLPIFPNP